ncbi:MAG: nucleoside recognition domain-containing protein [Syntrophaceticus sp.]|jgi:ferrous iron transport protein B
MGTLNTPLSSLLSRIENEIEPQDRQEIRDSIVSSIYSCAASIAEKVAHHEVKRGSEFDQKIDNVVTSRLLGIPIMLSLLGVILWLTISGANYPSQLLTYGLFWIEDQLTLLFMMIGAPYWLHGLLVLGIYRGLAWVVSVMLPPMAIFFPLFTLLEDLGYLPRVAFNLDRFFKKACAHGKQALTMCMGFGCNAAGVISCRIIESPRERLIAILTNNFVPCNGRFPLLITLGMLFLGGSTVAGYNTLTATAAVVGLILLGIGITFLISWLLSKTVLKGMPSFFTLELPPYRKPQIGRILIRSLLDRTIFVLTRAVVVAAPAGAITWLLANIYIGELSIIAHLASWLNPFGQLLGLDGIILMAFILGLPANEIVLPIMIMGYLSAGAMLELDSLIALKALLVDNGWTWLTALSMMLFSLLHYPCGTTILTIYKETKSIKWTVFSVLMPLAVAIIVTLIVAQTAFLLNLV